MIQYKAAIYDKLREISDILETDMKKRYLAIIGLIILTMVGCGNSTNVSEVDIPEEK